jgi:hypothetical protein
VAELTSGKRSYERAELISAAHTAIVVASFFDCYRESLVRAGNAPAISQEEQEELALGLRTYGEEVCDLLYRSAAPAPAAQFGYGENKERVRHWQARLQARLTGFLRDLDAEEHAALCMSAGLLDAAADRYEAGIRWTKQSPTSANDEDLAVSENQCELLRMSQQRGTSRSLAERHHAEC